MIWEKGFPSSKFLERLGILKHDFSVFDDGDFEDIGTTWREGSRWWRSGPTVKLARMRSTVEFSRSRLLWPRDRVRLPLPRPLQ